MKRLSEYIHKSLNEAYHKNIQFSFKDLEDTECWFPNDDFTPQDWKSVQDYLAKTFRVIDKKKEIYEIEGFAIQVTTINTRCRLQDIVCNMEFDPTYKADDLVKPILALCDALTDCVYSTRGIESDVKKLLKQRM